MLFALFLEYFFRNRLRITAFIADHGITSNTVLGIALILMIRAVQCQAVDARQFFIVFRLEYVLLDWREVRDNLVIQLVLTFTLITEQKISTREALPIGWQRIFLLCLNTILAFSLLFHGSSPLFESVIPISFIVRCVELFLLIIHLILDFLRGFHDVYFF